MSDETTTTLDPNLYPRGKDGKFLSPPDVGTTTTADPHQVRVLSLSAQLLLNRIKAGNASRPQSITEHHVQVVEVGKAELQAAVDANPTHPVAAVYANALVNIPDGKVVHVEQPDLQALLENREVRVTVVDVDGSPRRYKTLV